MVDPETKAIQRLINAFEATTLPRDQWTHTAHLTVALWYLTKYALPTAVQQIREGIQRYNTAVGIRLTPNSGYHETITLFWIQVICCYVTAQGITGFTPDVITQLMERYGDPQLPFRYYSRDRLLSWDARINWIEPDLQALAPNNTQTTPIMKQPSGQSSTVPQSGSHASPEQHDR